MVYKMAKENIAILRSKGLLAMRGTNENFSCSKSSLGTFYGAPKPTTKVGYDNFRNYFDYTTVNNTMKTIHSDEMNNPSYIGGGGLPVDHNGDCIHPSCDFLFQLRHGVNKC